MSRLDEALARLELAVARLEAACAGQAGRREKVSSAAAAKAKGRRLRAAVDKIAAEDKRWLAGAGQALGERGKE
ncbi:MAG: hypothetical protein JO081_04090 [Alphaproteobacteria bacterium]|nr:hypothetical protein [Alphaproteobacteria bacterium]